MTSKQSSLATEQPRRLASNGDGSVSDPAEFEAEDVKAAMEELLGGEWRLPDTGRSSGWVIGTIPSATASSDNYVYIAPFPFSNSEGQVQILKMIHGSQTVLVGTSESCTVLAVLRRDGPALLPKLRDALGLVPVENVPSLDEFLRSGKATSGSTK